MAQNQTGTSGKGTQGQSGQSGMQGTSGTQGSSATQGQTGTQGRMGTRAGNAGTGADNVTYDLISVAYHALQAAQTYQQYEQDAGKSDELPRIRRHSNTSSRTPCPSRVPRG